MTLLGSVGCTGAAPEVVDEGGFTVDGLTQEELWPQCPDLEPYDDTEGPFWLQIRPDAAFCSSFAGRDPYSAFADTTQIRLMPGDLFLPLDEGTHQVPLRSCVEAPDNDVAPLGPATWTVTRTATFGEDFIEAVLEQPLRMDSHLDDRQDDSGLGVLKVTVSGSESAMQNAIVGHGIEQTANVSISLCANRACDGREVFFDRCDRTEGRVERFTVDADYGTFHVVTVADPHNDAFDGSVALVEGTLYGDTFSVAGFPMAMARPSWEQSVYRDVMVRFLSPVDGFCYLHVDSFSPWNSGVSFQLFRCDSEETIWEWAQMEYELVDDGLSELTDGGVIDE